MPRPQRRPKLQELSHEIRNCSSALTMTVAGINAGLGLSEQRTLGILENCAKRLLSVSRALERLSAVKPIARRGGTLKSVG